MSDLTEFVLSRIAEDESAARACDDARPLEDGALHWHDAGAAIGNGSRGIVAYDVYSGAARAHIARHDPARVLAQCAALRAVVEEHDGDHDCVRYIDPADNNPCPTLRALASIWARHPDYREEWRR